MEGFAKAPERRFETHVVADPADVLVVSHRFRELAAHAGFPHLDQAELELVARELATNILKHAGRGAITIRLEAARITIEASDDGPGMPDVQQAFADGYSSADSLGSGLGSVNRLMDHVEITSHVGRGTVVTAHRTLRPVAEIMHPSPVAVGVATAPKPGFADNGDGYVIRSWDSKLMVGVLDGIGHGAAAKAATQRAVSYIDAHFEQPLEAIFRGVGIACRGTRGVVMALARFDWAAHTIEFASIGNVEARVYGVDQPMVFPVRRGILGVNAPDPRVTTVPWPTHAMLVLFSDGVVRHWGDTAPASSAVSASALAQRLLSDFNRLTDDATLLVVKPRDSA